MCIYKYMNKKLYQVPATKVNSLDNLKTTTDMYDSKLVGSFIRSTTEDKLCKIFSNWIDEDVKRHADILDLREIKWDIDNCENFSDANNMPKMSTASRWQSAINIFCNIKEEKIWETINFIDIPDYIEWICGDIRILQPPKDNNRLTNEKHVRNVWFKFIIPAIRNCIMHNRCIITKNGLYIYSEKSLKRKTNKKDKNWNNIKEEKNFEAFIDFDFFLKIIAFSFWSERKLKYKLLNTFGIDWEKWLGEFIKTSKFTGWESKKKWLLHSGIEDLTLFRMKNDIQDYDSQKLTNGQKEFFLEYFKTHEFNRRNVELLWMYMDEGLRDERSLRTWWCDSELLSLKKILFKTGFPMLELGDPISYLIMDWFLKWSEIWKWKIWNDDEKIKQDMKDMLVSNFPKLYSRKFVNNIIKLKEFILDLKYYFLAHKDFYSSKMKMSYRKNYLKVLYLSKFYVNNPKLKLAEPQKRVWDKMWKQWRDFIMNKCRKNSESYWSEEIKRKNINKKINKNIKTPYRKSIFTQLTSWGNVDSRIIKKNDDVNKIMNKINIFCTKDTKHLRPPHKKILKDNVGNVIKEWKEKLDNITIIWEEEHIRNAFAHHNYTIVPWFNKILLWDPSIDDTPNWEKVYDLDELYQNAVNRVEEDYLDKK